MKKTITERQGMSSGYELPERIIQEEYDSLFEYQKEISKREPSSVFLKEFETKEEMPSITLSKSFTGTDTYEDADKLLQGGAPELASKIVASTSAVDVQMHGETSRARLQYAVAGGVPLVPRYLTGAPNCMLSCKREPVRSKIIDIVHDVCVGCNTPTETIERENIKLACVIKKLELSGYRVNLYVSALTYEMNYGEEFYYKTPRSRRRSKRRVRKDVELLNCIVKVKDSGSPYNARLVSYPTLHPSFFRRHMFRWIETQPDVKSEGLPRGYGRAMWDIERVRNVIKIAKPKAFCTSIYYLEDKTDEQLIADIKAHVA